MGIRVWLGGARKGRSAVLMAEYGPDQKESPPSASLESVSFQSSRVSRLRNGQRLGVEVRMGGVSALQGKVFACGCVTSAVFVNQFLKESRTDLRTFLQNVDFFFLLHTNVQTLYINRSLKK